MLIASPQLLPLIFHQKLIPLSHILLVIPENPSFFLSFAWYFGDVLNQKQKAISSEEIKTSSCHHNIFFLLQTRWLITLEQIFYLFAALNKLLSINSEQNKIRFASKYCFSHSFLDEETCSLASLNLAHLPLSEINFFLQAGSGNPTACKSFDCHRWYFYERI